MHSMMSFVRRPKFESPDCGTAAYHIVVPSAETSLEIATSFGGGRTRADAVTALFIGPLTISALMTRVVRADSSTADVAATGCAPLVVTLTASMINEWSALFADTLFDRSKLLRQPIVMSASTLLLAQRLRLRLAGRRQPASSPFLCIHADDDETTPLLNELFSDFLAVDPASLFRRSSSRRTLVDRAREVLAGCPGSSHRLTDLAEGLGVSVFHFARLFRAETTLSVHQYLLRLRMARALQRLSCSEVDLSRLALEIGFSSHSHFSATFHKQFGASPAQVRNLFKRSAFSAWPASGDTARCDKRRDHRAAASRPTRSPHVRRRRGAE